MHLLKNNDTTRLEAPDLFLGPSNSREKIISGQKKTWELRLMEETPVSLAIYPMFYQILYISGGAGFLPSTIVLDSSFAP